MAVATAPTGLDVLSCLEGPEKALPQTKYLAPIPLHWAYTARVGSANKRSIPRYSIVSRVSSFPYPFDNVLRQTE